MKTIAYCFLLKSLLLFGQSDSISKRLQNKIDHQSEHPVHGILFYVHDENKAFTYNEGFGLVDKKGEPVTRHSAFRIASSTKLFVSTIILQLEEDGKLNLKDKAFSILKPKGNLSFDDFHVLDGINYSEEITIEHLLSHRSGLADIFTDKEDEFFSLIFENPNTQYSPESIIALYKKYDLNSAPHFRPQEGWHYSDMNYVLLGLIIEQLDQSTLSASIRNRILEPLHMEHTYFEYYETPKKNIQTIQQYVGDTNFSKINTSFDWSGGGLVSTNSDLAIFIKGLFNLSIIDKTSLNKMIDVKFTKTNESRYGLGVYELIINGEVYYGHFGFYGSFIGYSPKNKKTISYCISQALPNFNVYKFISDVTKRI
ncbi:serine hydrolase domain-containing protein [Psychroserpens ponticola]|uniref:Serine hydrolase n=1 Tax=Psychroserpens ponticola TaxID=2932268 RepID=A0ABY7S3X6_9FLAO|nr:serine hydrolase domain-containing protein [Psychroserpens ponticola]WCO03151.1 serine hydrolase [Psychroserpens ponticola]